MGLDPNLWPWLVPIAYCLGCWGYMAKEMSEVGEVAWWAKVLVTIFAPIIIPFCPFGW